MEVPIKKYKNANISESNWITIIEEKYLDVGDVYTFSIYPYNNTLVVKPLAATKITIIRNLDNDKMTTKLKMDTQNIDPTDSHQGYLFLQAQFKNDKGFDKLVDNVSFISNEYLNDINSFKQTINYDASNNTNFKLFLWDKDMRPYQEPVDLLQ